MHEFLKKISIIKRDLVAFISELLRRLLFAFVHLAHEPQIFRDYYESSIISLSYLFTMSLLLFIRIKSPTDEE